MSPGNCDKKMNEFVTRSESRNVTAHGIFNKNMIRTYAVQMYKSFLIDWLIMWVSDYRCECFGIKCYEITKFNCYSWEAII